MKKCSGRPSHPSPTPLNTNTPVTTWRLPADPTAMVCSLLPPPTKSIRLRTSCRLTPETSRYVDALPIPMIKIKSCARPCALSLQPSTVRSQAWGPREDPQGCSGKSYHRRMPSVSPHAPQIAVEEGPEASRFWGSLFVGFHFLLWKDIAPNC